MSTQGRGVRVKNPTTKLTTDNLVKPLLSSHRENIAAAEARKHTELETAPPTSQSAQVSGTSSSTITAAPPLTTGPSITAASSQASSSAPPAKRSFKATVVDEDEDGEFDQSSDSEPAPAPGKGKGKKREKKRARKSKSTHILQVLLKDIPNSELIFFR
jgi:hypothetical protein